MIVKASEQTIHTARKFLSFYPDLLTVDVERLAYFPKNECINNALNFKLNHNEYEVESGWIVNKDKVSPHFWVSKNYKHYEITNMKMGNQPVDENEEFDAIYINDLSILMYYYQTKDMPDTFVLNPRIDEFHRITNEQTEELIKRVNAEENAFGLSYNFDEDNNLEITICVSDNV